MKTNRTPRSIRQVLGALTLAALVAVGITACDPNAPADCSVDCVDILYASEGGDMLNILGKGAIFAEATIYADAARTQVVGYARDFTLASGHPNLPITKSYQALPIDNPARVYLKPNTQYWYKVRATGAGSTPYIELGTFKTKQRIITITWTTLNVFGDSDTTGAGELTFHMRANGTNASKVLGPASIATGYYRTDLTATKVITGTGNTATVEVRGYDDDCVFSTCTLPDGTWGKGSNADLQWDTAKATITVPNAYGSGTWTAQAGDAGSISDLLNIGFSASGTWNVRYEYA